MSSNAAQKQWQPWQMGTLERRTHDRSSPTDGEGNGNAPARRREDGISFALFELAKEEATEKGREAGYAAGLEQGRAEGEAKAYAEHKAELDAQLEQMLGPIRGLAGSFHGAVASLNDNVSYALVELALETGHQLAGRALELKPEHILDDVEALLAEHPTIGGSPTLYVNIEDFDLIETHLSKTLAGAGWSLQADMNMARGDCRIETPQTAVDVTIGDRWNRLLHTVGHGQH